MTTVLLNLHNAGLFPLDTMILSMGIFFGGIGQIIAGIMEWRKNNVFGATAFTSFGAFWLVLVGLLVLPTMGWGEVPSTTAMVSFLVLWGIFTTVMFYGTLKIGRSLQVVFGSLAALFFLLAIGDATGSTLVTRIAGLEGIFCGGSAIYTALGHVLNEVYGRTVLPL
jgi:succinate-acetate transporter protein